MIYNLEITEEERIHLIESLMNLNYTSIEKDIHLKLMEKLQSIKDYEKNITADFLNNFIEQGGVFENVDLYSHFENNKLYIIAYVDDDKSEDIQEKTESALIMSEAVVKSRGDKIDVMFYYKSDDIIDGYQKIIVV